MYVGAVTGGCVVFPGVVAGGVVVVAGGVVVVAGGVVVAAGGMVVEVADVVLGVVEDDAPSFFPPLTTDITHTTTTATMNNRKIAAVDMLYSRPTLLSSRGKSSGKSPLASYKSR